MGFPPRSAGSHPSRCPSISPGEHNNFSGRRHSVDSAGDEPARAREGCGRPMEHCGAVDPLYQILTFKMGGLCCSHDDPPSKPLCEIHPWWFGGDMSADPHLRRFGQSPFHWDPPSLSSIPPAAAHSALMSEFKVMVFLVQEIFNTQQLAVGHTGFQTSKCDALLACE